MKKLQSFSLPQTTLLFLNHPWRLFFIFLIVNTYLSYAGSLEAKLWVGLYGLVIPFLVLAYFLLLIPLHSKPFFEFKKENPKSSLSWVVFFLIAVGIFVRIYKIKALSVWPIFDDGYFSLYAVDLTEKWHWQIIFGWVYDAPLYIWIQSLYFKCLEPSISSVWLYPIFYSILILPLSFLVVRKYFSFSFSLIYLGLLSLSFWPILASRFTNDLGLSLVWQYLVLWGFFPFFKSLESKKDPTIFQTILLGALIGLGSYTSKFWIITMAVFSFIAWYCLLHKPRINFKKFLTFNLTLVVFAFPFLFLLLKQGFASRLHDVFLGKASDPAAVNLFTGFPYLTALFWGIPHYEHFTFGPFLGGFLNPILDSAFFIGLLKIIYLKKEKGILAVFLIGGMFLLPFLFSQSNWEMMRIFLILPFLFLVVTIGCQTLLADLPSCRKWACLTLAGVSLFVDLFQLWVPYHAWAIPENTTDRSKSLISYQVFQVLKKAYRPLGPGLIMTDFLPDVFDQTLLAATYPFNALRNPKWTPEEATWACVWVKREYEDYLHRRFPESRYYRIDKVESKTNWKTTLFIIPINNQNRATLLRWGVFHRSIQPFYPYFFENPDNPGLVKTEKEFSNLYSLAKDDNFLLSIFWWKKDMLPDFQSNCSDQEKAIHQLILQKGTESFWNPLIGHMNFQLGVFYGLQQDYVKSRRSFVQAGLYDPNYAKARRHFIQAGFYDPTLVSPEERAHILDLMKKDSLGKNKSEKDKRE